MSITEAYLRESVIVDREAEPEYGEDQIFICYPRRFATVRITLEPTGLLDRVTGTLRRIKGIEPDRDDRYSYSIYLNALTEKPVCNCMEAAVHTDCGPDDGETYYITLTSEEQEVLQRVLDDQCRRAYGMGCRELLEEAGRRMDDEPCVSLAYRK